MDPYAINGLIIVGIIANVIIPRLHKLAGAIFGFVFSTVVLIVGLVAYAEGGSMALRGVLRIPQWLFLLLVAVWYAFDVHLLRRALREQRESKELDQDVVSALRQGKTPLEILSMLVARSRTEETDAADVADRILGGATYSEVIASIRQANDLDMGQAALVYKRSVDMILRMESSILDACGAQHVSTDEKGWLHPVFPAVMVHSRAVLGSRLNLFDLIVAYNNQPVVSVDDLARLSSETGQDEKVDVTLLRFDRVSDKWVVINNRARGSGIHTKILKCFTNSGTPQTSCRLREIFASESGQSSFIREAPYLLLTGRRVSLQELVDLPTNIMAGMALYCGVCSIIVAITGISLVFAPVGIVTGLAGIKTAHINGIGVQKAKAGVLCSIIALVVTGAFFLWLALL